MASLKIFLIINSIGGASSDSYSPVENDDSSLIDFSDDDIEQELRKRWLGGPWSPEQTVSILNEALDQISGKTPSFRNRRFTNEARYLLELISGESEPRVEFSEDDDEDYSDVDNEDRSGHKFSRETMQKIVDMFDGANGQNKRSHSSIQTLYRNYEPYLLARFRKRLQNSSRLDRLRNLDKNVTDVFAQARRNLQPVHGRMIQRWAKQYATANSIDNFSASDGWLNNFKRRHGIVSRKVTLYTSRSEKNNEQNIRERIANFTELYSRVSVPFEKAAIWNFDQTGFNYEPSNLRTLSYRGERDTTLLLDSRNKHTHSYTVQPMISRDGRLFPILLIVTQETSNVWGPRVGPSIEDMTRQFGNVEVYPSTSGKLTSYLIDKWFNGTLRNAIRVVRAKNMVDDDEPAAMVLADSWSGHSKGSQVTDLRTMGAKLVRIPPSTTDRLQPLDVNFNRQLKIFYNRIMEESFYQDLMNETITRRGVINIHSLMHNQLSSSLYNDMIRFAWRNTDPSFNVSEMTNHPPRMVNSIQFGFDQAAKCEVDGCGNYAFLKCSHCGKLLCIHHFLNRTCFHGVRTRGTRSLLAGDQDDEEYQIKGTFVLKKTEETTTTMRPTISGVEKLRDQFKGLSQASYSVIEALNPITTFVSGVVLEGIGSTIDEE